MMNVRFLPALAGVLAGHAMAATLAGPPSGAVWLEGRDDKTLDSVAGDPAASATWHIAQWMIPNELTGVRAAGAHADWQLANAYAEVAWKNDSGVYELATNGRLAKPECKDEFDLFLEPNGPPTPRSPQGIRPSAPLNEINSVRLHFGYRLAEQAVTGKCEVNYASSTVALVLSNPARNQTLFYQVILIDSRGGRDRGPAMRRAWCPGDSTTDFCVDTHVARFGMPVPEVGGPRRIYDFELYDELRSLIREGHASLDTDLAHWRVQGLYAGNIVLGGAATKTQWDGLTLTASP